MRRLLPTGLVTAAFLLGPLLGAGLEPAAVELRAAETEESRPRYAGRPLAEALQDLRSRGLNLIYSTDLVRPEMIVETEPTASSLHQMLQEILGPHGLEAQIGPLGSVLVVNKPGGAILVTIEKPMPDQAVFGWVEVEARVLSDQPIEQVEFRLDGRPIEIVRRPPWRIRVDVGTDNVERRFEVVAEGSWGGEGRAEVITRSVNFTDQVEVALKQLFVTVTRNGGPALELSREDFTVLDGGVEQELVTFERGDVPITAVLLVDASESMHGGALTAALDGSRTFVRNMAPLDEAMVMLFSDRTLAATRFSHRSEALVSELEGVEARGGTALNDHLYAALRLLDARRGRRVVIMVSDGADVLSALDIADVAWKIRRSDCLVYWIRLEKQRRQTFSSVWRDFEANRAEWEGLTAAVEQSGGRIVVLAGIDQIGDAFEEIMRELRSQYVLGYYPSERHHDGDWRRVRVRVDEPRARVRFRAGYVDQ